MNAIFDTERFQEELRKAEVVIVEGAKDKKALHKLGIDNVRPLNGPIYKFCEELAFGFNSAVILTDLDKEGKRLYSKVKDCLSRNGVRVDDSFRNMLFRKTELRQIEGLESYLAKKDAKRNHSLNLNKNNAAPEKPIARTTK